MALISKKTPEQRAIEAGIKEQEREAQQKQREAQQKQRERAQAEKQAQERAEERESMRQAFFATPAGQARLAFEDGDQVFQYSSNVMKQQAIIVAMVGSTTSKRTADPVAILNSVCNEGWELLNGSFVFVEEGQQSRDKFGSSGQNIATKGSTVGYYLFRRCEANRRDTPEPWQEL
jgi:hypothetical protein